MNDKFPQSAQFPPANEAMPQLNEERSTWAEKATMVLLAVVVAAAALAQMVDAIDKLM